MCSALSYNYFILYDGTEKEIASSQACEYSATLTEFIDPNSVCSFKVTLKMGIKSHRFGKFSSPVGAVIQISGQQIEIKENYIVMVSKPLF